MMQRRKIEGIVLLALAALFFWLPSYMQMPAEASGKLLVASPDMSGGFFDKSVVLVMRHDGYGAWGFIVNRPAENPSDPAIGGPVDPDKVMTLHSLDVADDATEKVEKLNLGVTEGEGFVHDLTKRERKPSEYIILKGYAGWGRNQLQQEIARGGWRVMDLDRALVFNTPPEKMYEEALKK